MLIEKYKNKYFMFYADCFITTGVHRISILDTTNGKIHFINSDYEELINLFPKYKIETIVKEFILNEDEQLFEHFLSEMIKIDVGCFVDDIECFPKLKEEWDSPSEIVNSIIDIRSVFYDFDIIIEQLNCLRCKYLQVRFYRCATKKEIDAIASKIKGTSILYLEIISKFNTNMFNLIDYFVDKYTFLYFFIYSTPKNLMQKRNYHSKLKMVHYSINSANDCGKINKQHFIKANIDSYMHNLLYNGCLNRKISIDENGNIKNCPSMEKSYGNISKDSLVDISRMDHFREVWYINKSKIEVCKDCEYRCLCSDCRAYISDPNNIYSKPLKCHYNPYKKL